ncbi:glycosyl hydrolases family 11-domain-containing protein [Panaeolus papilionaceus]|nr:glycosyl hydrolases family 11-domain-containing protein [Panaeolus papilionaceus]
MLVTRRHAWATEYAPLYLPELYLMIFKAAIATPIIGSSVLAASAHLDGLYKTFDVRSGTPSSSGTLPDGRFYYWKNGNGTTESQANYTTGGGGSYTISWSGDEYLMGGKGWNPGGSRVIRYSANYNANGNSALTVYGWTRDPLIEYYIVEAYSTYGPPSGAQKKGTTYCDGANYDLFQTTRYDQPSIDGTQTFQNFMSIRNPKKNSGNGISGTVTASCHFNSWANAGMMIGSTHIFQILAVESYYGNGSAAITVS